MSQSFPYGIGGFPPNFQFPPHNSYPTPTHPYPLPPPPPPQPQYSFQCPPSFPPQVNPAFSPTFVPPSPPFMVQKRSLDPNIAFESSIGSARKKSKSAHGPNSEQPWKDDVATYKPRGNTSLNQLGSQVENIVYDLADGSCGDAADIILKVIKRASVEEQVATQLESNGAVFNALNAASSIKSFLHKPMHSSSAGPRLQPLQYMVNGFNVGMQYDRDPRTPDSYYTDLLGVSRYSVQKAAEHAAKIHGDDSYFHMNQYEHTSKFLEFQYRKKVAIWDWQHSWLGSRVDTFTFYNHTVEDPHGNICDHARRVFHEKGNDAAFARFRDSPQYALLCADYPGKGVGQSYFADNLCPCTRDPDKHSCVDVDYAQIDLECRALLHALYHNAEVKEGKKNCSCDFCTLGLEPHMIGPMRPSFWRDNLLDFTLQSRPSELAANMCCHRVPREELKAPNDVVSPSLVNWRCARGECENCGPGKKLPSLDCEFMNSCETEVPVQQYKKKVLESGTKQWELQPSEKKSVKEIIEDLKLKICAVRMHYARDRWTNTIQKLHEQLSSFTDLLIKADFSATANLSPMDAPNSAQDSHAVLLVLTASYNFRNAPIEHKDEHGNVARTEYFRTCDTDHWHFWGPSAGKSKKNDHIYFNACKDYVINFYKEKFQTELNRTLRRVRVWTDNCPGQFGCAQTYANVATSDEVNGIICEQYFAERDCFKCIIDALGKVAKQDGIEKGELNSVRSPHAFDCVVNSIKAEKARLAKDDPDEPRPEQVWAKYEAERDPRLKLKGTFVLHERFHLYVTDDPDDVERRVQSGFERNLIVLTNRKTCDEVSGCENSKSFWAFEGLPKFQAQVLRGGVVQVDKCQLDMKFMPCFCLSCQNNADIRLWEQEHQQVFEGFRPQPCEHLADIASPYLPERPPRTPGQPRPPHAFRHQKGVCTIFRHIDIADEDLEAYISPLKENGDFLRSEKELKNQLRSRGISQGDKKRDHVRKLREWLTEKGLLPEPVPQAAVPVPQDAAPFQQAANV